MTVRVAEVACVSAIKGRLRLACHSATRFRRRHDYVRHLALGPHVVSEYDARETSAIATAVSDARVQSELLTAPQCQHYAAGLKEDGFFDLLAMPAQLLVEPPRSVDV